ncbi:MAG: hypothetical protein IJM53_07255 [Lachnospiraceae bacterium]|nr:hypothetical protein [Lachnospiraceae bacterium]
MRKYNTAMQIFAEGNTVRVVSEPEIKKAKRTTVVTEPVKEEKKPARTARKATPTRKAARPAQAAAGRTATRSRKKPAGRFSKIVAIAIATVTVIGMSMLYLSTVVENNELVRNIGILETQLDDLKAKNDAKEFEINSAVDLNFVIKYATEDLGMVRGTAEQIRIYDTSNSEYIQHLAGIPSE